MTGCCDGCGGITPATGRYVHMEATGLRVDHEARKWLGVPFMHQGRTRKGIDCLGLVSVSLQAVGWPVDDLTDYSRDPHAQTLESELARQLTPVCDLRPGYVVAMAFPRVTRHVGILGEYPHGGLSLIHTWNKAGKVIEHRLDDKWTRLIRSAYSVEARA